MCVRLRPGAHLFFERTAMPGGEAAHTGMVQPELMRLRATPRERASAFPYWLVVFVGILIWMTILVATNQDYNDAYHFIIPGLGTTISATLVSFVIALGIGMTAGFGRMAKNAFVRNIAQLYIEFVRGVPILVLMFTITYAIVPQIATAVGFKNSSVSFFTRATIALAVIYGAYLAEVFRAGIESVPKGQVEAGRSLGLSHTQTMVQIVLPQAIRNMIPAIGNDLIAMLKDTSLLSVLAINELTQNARLNASSTFKYRPTYFVLTLVYASMTLFLSMLLRWYRSRLGLDDD